MQKIIKCSDCEYCGVTRPLGNTRYNFTCEHPDQKYIREYFREKRMSKMPGFLASSKAHSGAMPIKTSPAWCPKKKKEEGEA